MAGAHLLDIALGMKPVAVFAAPAQSFGELAGDGAFARTGHPHDDEGARRFAGLIGHQTSPAGRRDRRAIWSRLTNGRGPPEDHHLPARGSISEACSPP